ncbi:MAG: alanine--tRNA ligase, partial [Clostridia bacterium]|nr:alanine--tRNA ligase [Clostridia bacterium]
SNEGRGYVLRRILRRAVRFGRSLGLTGPFLYQLVETVAETLKDVYPALPAECTKIAKVIYQEEERFFVTLQDGLNIFAGIIEKIKAAGRNQISGEEAFLLYDTYGFPIDLTRDVAEENGFSLDTEGFEAAMARQKAMARAARAEQAGGEDFIALGQLLLSVEASRFCGYSDIKANAKVTALIKDGVRVDQLKAGESGWLALDKTPFYAESGGQVGDSGLMTAEGLQIKVEDTRKLPSGLFVHRVSVEQGTVALEDMLNAAVDSEKRRAVTANHSATHLLHRALRDLLGEEVHQAGSFVCEDYLRFDFNYPTAVDREALQKVEDTVNEQVFANLPITFKEMPKDEAIALGAAAFFGDKYGDVVRVVTIGDYSLELCGGCHAKSTAEIGFVKIISEGGIAAGLRRIEMITGKRALAYYKEEERRLAVMAALMKANPADAEKRLEKLLAENKEMKNKLEKLAGQAAGEGASSLNQKAITAGGLKVVVQALNGIDDMSALRGFMDAARDQADISVLLFGAAFGDKVQFVAAADQKAQKAGLHAGNLIKAVATVCGGGGGGRPDMAQAGAKDASKLAEALKEGERMIKEILG